MTHSQQVWEIKDSRAARAEGAAGGRWTRREFLALGSLALVAGCETQYQTEVGREAARPVDRERLYDRARVRLANAVLYKPSVQFAEDPAYGLAPLFLFEVLDPGDTGEVAMARLARLYPGVVNPWGPEVWRVVHVFEDEVLVGGEVWPRVSYLWLQPRGVAGDQTSFTTQGIRIVANRSGHPVLWEVVADSTGARLLFVSASLEAAALTVHGPPLPGRRFACEREVAEAPRTVVARVLEDGPTPMGPIVYVQPRTANVLTVVCRCMPAQVTNVFETAEYAMYVLDPEDPVEARAIRSLTRGLVNEPPDELERQLRLPRSLHT